MYHAVVASRPFPLVAGVLLVDACSALIIIFGVKIDGRFLVDCWMMLGLVV